MFHTVEKVFFDPIHIAKHTMCVLVLSYALVHKLLYIVFG